MNFKTIKNGRSRLLSVLLICMITVLSFCGCSLSYILDDDVIDSLTDSAYSSNETASDSAVSEIEEDNPTTAESENEENNSTAAEYTFRSEKLLNEHFEKHNSDFGYETAEEYVEGANRVINDENSLHKLEAEDGDDVYYLEETNEFVIVSTDGYIRTYFCPDSGKKYFDKQ